MKSDKHADLLKSRYGYKNSYKPKNVHCWLSSYFIIVIKRFKPIWAVVNLPGRGCNGLLPHIQRGAWAEFMAGTVETCPDHFWDNQNAFKWNLTIQNGSQRVNLRASPQQRKQWFSWCFPPCVVPPARAVMWLPNHNLIQRCQFSTSSNTVSDPFSDLFFSSKKLTKLATFLTNLSF